MEKIIAAIAAVASVVAAYHPDPAAMTDSKIYAELSMISERQLKRWEMLETELPQLQLESEALGKDLETLSLSLNQAEKTFSNRTSLLEKSRTKHRLLRSGTSSFWYSLE